jgi:1-phosphofructokinase family hexose kinase
LRQGLVDDDIRAELIEIEEETRFTVALVEDDGTTTLVNEPGPRVSPESCRRLIDTAVAAARPDDVVLLTGSLPPGAPESLYLELIEALGGNRVVVDSGGAVLERCLPAQPYLVKPNLAEAHAHGADPASAAEALVAAGAQHALVTVGAAGAVLAGGGPTLRAIAPRVNTANPTGSGDALAAGILVGLESGRSLPEALRLGIAAAAENASHGTAGKVERKGVQALEAQVEIVLH